MKKKGLLLSAGLALLTVAVAAPKVALAHIEATNGQMTATMHIAPDDNPLAGQPETLLFIYQDNANKFNAFDCNCVASVNTADQQVFKSIVSAKDVYYGQIHYNFGKAATYHINIVGQPKKTGQFKPFSLSFTVKVGRNPDQSELSSADKTILGLVGLVGLIAIASASYVFRRSLKLTCR